MYRTLNFDPRAGAILQYGHPGIFGILYVWGQTVSF